MPCVNEDGSIHDRTPRARGVQEGAHPTVAVVHHGGQASIHRSQQLTGFEYPASLPAPARASTLPPPLGMNIEHGVSLGRVMSPHIREASRCQWLAMGVDGPRWASSRAIPALTMPGRGHTPSSDHSRCPSNGTGNSRSPQSAPGYRFYGLLTSLTEPHAADLPSRLLRECRVFLSSLSFGRG